MHIRKIAGAAAMAAALSILTPAMAADTPGADIARGAMPVYLRPPFHKFGNVSAGSPQRSAVGDQPRGFLPTADR